MEKKRPTREQQAWEEIGHTEHPPAVAPVLAGVGLATLLLVALLQPMEPDPRLGETPFTRLGWAALEFVLEPARGFAGNRELVAEIRAFELALEESSWLRQAAQPWVQEVLTRWGRVGNNQVHFGRDGWLFYALNVDHVMGRGFLEPAVMARRRAVGVSPDPVPAIVDFHRQLAARGIHLIVLPVPAKVTIVPRGLARDAPDPTQVLLRNPSFAQLLSRLETAGVEVFDPTPILLRVGPRAFLRTDSHWAPEGMTAVAVELAHRLDQLGLVGGEPVRQYRRERLVQLGRGDLTRILSFRSMERVVGAERVETMKVLEPDGAPWKNDPTATVLLLGDSHANVYSWDKLGWGVSAGFAEQLSFALGRPVNRLAILEKSDLGVRQALAVESRTRRGWLAGKRVVVYEIAARQLSLGDWRLVELTTPADENPPR